MEELVIGKPRYKILMMEDSYMNLVKRLLIGKFITFECEECGKHTGICDRIEFSGGGYPGGPEPDKNKFDIQYIHIKTEDFDRLNGLHGIDGDEVIVHLDIDPELYRNTKKYNI